MSEPLPPVVCREPDSGDVFVFGLGTPARKSAGVWKFGRDAFPLPGPAELENWDAIDSNESAALFNEASAALRSGPMRSKSIV